MKGRKLDIRAGSLFPVHFLVLGAVILLAGLGFVVNHPIGGGIAIAIALLILTAYEGTEINPDARTIREYYAFLFVKTGTANKYRNIEEIALHKATVSQRIFTPRTMNSSTFSHVEYNAYLKLGGGEKIFLFGGRNKSKVKARADEVARRLNTTVADHAVVR